MKKQLLTLPLFDEVVNGTPCRIDPTEWSEAQAQKMVEGLFLQGTRIILQRLPPEAVPAKMEQLQSGAYPFGGAGKGGGKTLSPTVRGEILWAKLKLPAKAAAKINGKTIKDFLVGQLKAEIFNATEAGEGREELLGQIYELFPEWRLALPDSEPELMKLIQIEKDLEKVKAVGTAGAGSTLAAILAKKAEKSE